MNSRMTGPTRPAGGGLVALVLAVLVVTSLYLGGEWLMTQQVKTELTELLRQDTRSEIAVEAVGMDGWLFSGRRSGNAAVSLPSNKRVPVEFTVVGNPVSGLMLNVEGEQVLKLRLQELFGNML
jgi:hypothetical protein